MIREAENSKFSDLQSIYKPERFERSSCCENYNLHKNTSFGSYGICFQIKSQTATFSVLGSFTSSSGESVRLRIKGLVHSNDTRGKHLVLFLFMQVFHLLIHQQRRRKTSNEIIMFQVVKEINVKVFFFFCNLGELVL